jgi:hypothetical protein
MDESKLKEILDANQAEHMARMEAIEAKWRARRLEMEADRKETIGGISEEREEI